MNSNFKNNDINNSEVKTIPLLNIYEDHNDNIDTNNDNNIKSIISLNLK